MCGSKSRTGEWALRSGDPNAEQWLAAEGHFPYSLQVLVSAHRDVTQITLLSVEQSELCVELRPRPSSKLWTNQLEPLRLKISWSSDQLTFSLQVSHMIVRGLKKRSVPLLFSLLSHTHSLLLPRWRKVQQVCLKTVSGADIQSWVPPCWRWCSVTWVRLSCCWRSRSSVPGQLIDDQWLTTDLLN